MSGWVSEHAFDLVWGVVLFLAGVATSAWLSWLQRRRKILDWVQKADEALVHEAASRYTPDLTVTVGNFELSDPRVVALRIRNSGKEEVVEADYTQPITIDVPGAEIVDAVVTAVSEEGVYKLGSLRNDANASETTNTPVTLKPAVLNKNDWIDLQLIVNGLEGEPGVSTRFAGQTRKMKKQVPEDDVSMTGTQFLWVLAITLPVTLLIFSFIAYFPAEYIPSVDSPSFFIFVIIPMLILISAPVVVARFIYSRSKYKQKTRAK